MDEYKVALAKISSASKLETKKKEPYVQGNLSTIDGTSVTFKIWNDNRPLDFLKDFEEGCKYFKIQYQEDSFNNTSYFTIKSFLKMTTDEVNNSFLKKSLEKQKNLLDRLDKIIETNLSEKGKGFIKEYSSSNKEIWDRFLLEYAAKGMHDASPVGLLNHTVKMLEVLELSMKQHDYYGLNEDGKDLIFLGLLLHDIGKVKEYNEGTPTQLSKVTHRGLGIEITVLNKELYLKYYPEDFYYETIAIINQHHGIFEEKPHSIFSYYVHLVDMFDTHTTALYENITKNKDADTIRVIDRDIPVLYKNKVYFENEK